MKRNKIALAIFACVAGSSLLNASAATPETIITDGVNSATVLFENGGRYDFEAFDSDTKTNFSDIYDLKQAAKIQDDAITANTTEIASNQANIATNTAQNATQDNRLTNVENHTDAVDSHVQNIDMQQRKDAQTLQAHDNSIATLNTDVSQHNQRFVVDEASIAGNTSSITANHNAIASNQANIATNTAQNATQDNRLTNVENHTDAVDSHVQNIDIQQRKDAQTLQAHDNSIATLNTDVSQHNQRFVAEENNIATNKSAIAANSSALVANTADINANAQHIATDEQIISANNKNIVANEKNIASNAQHITTDEKNIASNTQHITTDEKNIAVNSKNITSLSAGVTQAEATGEHAQTRANEAFTTAQKAETTGEYAQSRADKAFAHAEANKQALAATNHRLAADDAELANHEQRIGTLESQTTSNFAKLKSQIDDNRKRASAGISGVAAMANIPQVTNTQDFSVGAGVGTADSESALAVGFSARATENVVVKASVSDDSQHNFVAGAGVSYGW